MKYPAINKQPRRTVTIPDLVGGINLRDGVSDILDNQMTESKNVWHHNGLLHTRPNLKADVNNKVVIGRVSSEQEVSHKSHKDIQRTINNQNYIFCSCLIEDGNDYSVKFWWQSETNLIQLPNITGSRFESITYFVVEKDSILYFFNSVNQCYKLDTDDVAWVLLSDDDLYAPLITTGGTAIDGTENNIGTQLESYNLICARYRMQFSTVNKTKASNEMKYPLLEDLKLDEGSGFDGTTVTAKITSINGSTVTHSATINHLGIGTELAAQSDGLILYVDGSLVTFYESDGTTVKVLTPTDYVENNMEITAPCLIDKMRKVFCMQRAEWFGGAANGINGGSRLFLGGNTAEGSLMVWSARDNPLYFPENNYAYVGKSSNAITAFGKQDDMLVIFKETETYYTHYVQNTNITADNLIDQSVVDYQASSVYFPIVQINAEIGCNVPDSVQLCRNRLVWANTNGSIYTLVSANQYSERNIYKLSAMVERDIVIPTYATSADWNGYYCLMCSDKMWLLKYDSYGYQYVSSYSKAEDATLKAPWFMWEFPFININNGNTIQENPHVSLLDDSLIVSVLNNMDSGQNVNVSAYTLNTDNASTEDEILTESDSTIIKSTYSFESIAQTKIFDFGLPSYRKNVDSVNVGLGNNGGAAVNVSFITDVGTESEEITPYGAEETAYNAEFINNYHISPCIKNVGKFGIRLQCNGILAVDNLNLQYRLLGGAK